MKCKQVDSKQLEKWGKGGGCGREWDEEEEGGRERNEGGLRKDGEGREGETVWWNNSVLAV